MTYKQKHVHIRMRKLQEVLCRMAAEVARREEARPGPAESATQRKGQEEPRKTSRMQERGDSSHTRHLEQARPQSPKVHQWSREAQGELFRMREGFWSWLHPANVLNATLRNGPNGNAYVTYILPRKRA